MSMFVKLSTRIINLAHVAFVEQNPNGMLEVHYSIPRAACVAGVQYDPHVSGPPAASDHFVEMLSGPDAVTLWGHLQKL